MNKRVPSERYDFSVETLQKFCPVGTTVYTSLQHVSRSGMSRVISCYVPYFREPDYRYPEGRLEIIRLDSWVSDVTGIPYDRNHEGLKIGGAGMDMGFSIVYDLGVSLHNDGYALDHRWL